MNPCLSFAIIDIFCRDCTSWWSKLDTSVGSVADFSTGGRWFDSRLGQYSFHGLMIATETGFIPVSPMSVVSIMVMWESSQWFRKNIVRSTDKGTPEKHG